MSRTVDEATTTQGIDLFGDARFGFVVGASTMLTAGVNVHYIIGNERVEALDETLDSAATHANLQIGAIYTF